MKLVRVSTDDPQAIFNGNLSADVSVAPNSSIALKSLSLEQRDNVIVIATDNDSITYVQGDTTYIAPNLTHGNYTAANYNVLMVDMEEKLNETAEYTIGGDGVDFVQGMEYRVGVDENLKLQIQARKGDLGEQPERWVFPASIDYDQTNFQTNEYSVKPSLPVDNCEVMLVEQRMPNGNGYCSAMASVLEYDADRTLNGFWICSTIEDLSQITPAQLKADIQDPAKRGICTFGVAVERITGGDFRYSSIKEGALTTIADNRPSAYLAHDPGNPVIRLQRSNHAFYASFVDDAGDVSVEIEDISPSQPYYQFIVFWQDEKDLATGMTEASVSAFDGVLNVSSTNDLLADQVAVGNVSTNYRIPRGMLDNVAAVFIPDYSPTRNRFFFENLQMAQQFGFSSVSVPTTGTRNGVNFIATANVKFGPRIVADTLIVLSENLPIQSYDTTQLAGYGAGQTRSILDVVPIPYGNEGVIAYQPSDLVFLDLNNATALSLRTIKFRIVTGDYVPLALNGVASIVFLIKEPEN